LPRTICPAAQGHSPWATLSLTRDSQSWCGVGMDWRASGWPAPRGRWKWLSARHSLPPFAMLPKLAIRLHRAPDGTDQCLQSAARRENFELADPRTGRDLPRVLLDHSHGVLIPLQAGRLLGEQFHFRHLRDNMADQDVGFLNARRFIRGYAQAGA